MITLPLKFIAAFFMFLLFSPVAAVADDKGNPSDCAQIDDHDQRLQCVKDSVDAMREEEKGKKDGASENEEEDGDKDRKKDKKEKKDRKDKKDKKDKKKDKKKGESKKKKGKKDKD